MRKIGILMRGAMVRAILREHPEEPKTVTRRTRGLDEINKDPDKWILSAWAEGPGGVFFARFDTKENAGKKFRIIPCPYGDVGDRLWVRENHAIEADGRVVYQADKAARYFADKLPAGDPFWLSSDYEPGRWRPSLHLPRWACRITLVRSKNREPERLQAISEDDCIREGIDGWNVPTGGDDFQDYWRNYLRPAEESEKEACAHFQGDPRASFRSLFESINGPEAWEANPWVWPIEFARILNHIDKE